MPDWLKDIGVFIATYTAVRVIIIVVEAMRRCDLAIDASTLRHKSDGTVGLANFDLVFDSTD